MTTAAPAAPAAAAAGADPAADRAKQFVDERIIVSTKQQFEDITKRIGDMEKSVAEALKGGGDEAKKKAEELDNLKQRIEILSAAVGRHSVSVPGVKDDKDGKNFSVLRAFRAIYTNDWSRAPGEARVFDAARKAMDSRPDGMAFWQERQESRTAVTKGQQAGTDTAGGYWIPAEIASDWIEILRPRLVLRRAGATFIENVNGAPFEIPGQSGGATAYMVGEDEAPTESSLTASMLKLYPKTVGAFVAMSRRALMLASNAPGGMEQVVRRDMMRAIARKMDLQCLQGSGIGANVKGLQSILGSGTGITGTVTTWQNFERLAGVVEDPDGFTGGDTDEGGKEMGEEQGTAFVSHPKVFRRLRLQGINQHATSPGDADQAPVWPGQPLLSNRALGSLFGRGFYTTSQLAVATASGGTGSVATYPVYFGQWPEMIIPMWAGIELEASPHVQFAKGQTHIRALADFDMQVRHSASFSWDDMDAA